MKEVELFTQSYTRGRNEIQIQVLSMMPSSLNQERYKQTSKVHSVLLLFFRGERDTGKTFFFFNLGAKIVYVHWSVCSETIKTDKVLGWDFQ